jgi:chaperonin GroES
MYMNVKPLEDRIVVEPSEAETTTVSGLVIPDTAKEKPQQGKVLAVGPGRTTDEGKVVAMAATPCCTQSTAEPKSRSRVRIF